MRTQQPAPQVCRECGVAHPVYQTRDLEITRRGRKAIVPHLSGWFCTACGEIEFDDSTDSLDKWAAAGDKLVMAARAAAQKVGDELKRARQALHITQVEAAQLAGGGHNAFSRYEKGDATPVVAVPTLFVLLQNHPELVPEAKELASRYA